MTRVAIQRQSRHAKGRTSALRRVRPPARPERRAAPVPRPATVEALRRLARLRARLPRQRQLAARQSHRLRLYAALHLQVAQALGLLQQFTVTQNGHGAHALHVPGETPPHRRGKQQQRCSCPGGAGTRHLACFYEHQALPNARYVRHKPAPGKNWPRLLSRLGQEARQLPDNERLLHQLGGPAHATPEAGAKQPYCPSQWQ